MNFDLNNKAGLKEIIPLLKSEGVICACLMFLIAYAHIFEHNLSYYPSCEDCLVRSVPFSFLELTDLPVFFPILIIAYVLIYNFLKKDNSFIRNHFYAFLFLCSSLFVYVSLDFYMISHLSSGHTFIDELSRGHHNHHYYKYIVYFISTLYFILLSYVKLFLLNSYFHDKLKNNLKALFLKFQSKFKSKIIAIMIFFCLLSLLSLLSLLGLLGLLGLLNLFLN